MERDLNRIARWTGALTVILVLAVVTSCASAGDDDGAYPVIRGSDTDLRSWIAHYDAVPTVPVDTVRQRVLSRSSGSMSLLDRIPFNASERNQGPIANCWVWSGTGILEAAHATRNGIHDRLSIQYFDSNYNGGSGGSWAGNGGSLGEFIRFYNIQRCAVPWSNANASYQDGRIWCRDNERAWIPAGSVGTDPHYDILSIAEQRVQTRGIGDTAARANIKAVLDSGRPVYLAFRLPDCEAWEEHQRFWNSQSETAVFDLSGYDGRTWTASGGGHAVLVIGYDDTDPTNPYWLILDSWGTANGNRPHGTFRLSMNMSYDGSYQSTFAVPSTEWETVEVTFADEGIPTLTPTVTQVTPGFAGTWQTEAGTMNLAVSGRTVTGTYEYEDGRVEGRLSPDGRILSGNWSDAPSYGSPDDQGTLELVLSTDGDSFQGNSYSADLQRQAYFSGRRVVPTPTIAVVPVPFPNQTLLPRDLDEDGMYEDVNGNGRRDFADVVLLFNHIQWCCTSQPAGTFDYNRNGRVDFSDVVTLYRAL
jgi:PKD repeat protein